MAQTVTPSQQATTDAQITKTVSNYRALLEKHRSEFPIEAFQMALGNPELAKNQFAVLRSFVEAVSKTVTRSSTVNRSRTFQEALEATKRNLYLDKNVVLHTPKAEGDFEGIFVNLGRNVDCDKLDDELGKLGLELIVDPQGLADLNASDPEFADKYPNGTQWKNKEGKYCCVIFDRWSGGCGVGVAQCGDYWDVAWWFPCRRKNLDN